MVLLFVCVGISAHTTDSIVTKTAVTTSPAQYADSVNNTQISDSVSAIDQENVVDIDTTSSDVRILTASEIAEAATAINTKQWIPNPKRALWLAIVLPGAGQIYNRKYWKLPIIYGGFIGCAYALMWNGTMYRDYSQAYQDIMDNDSNTKSYKNFLPVGYDVDSHLEYLQTLFGRKKNYFRRYRDLSIIAMIGVYLLSIVDAYVDAELSSFDISRDLTMKVRPTIFNERHSVRGSGMNVNRYGLQCSLNF